MTRPWGPTSTGDDQPARQLVELLVGDVGLRAERHVDHRFRLLVEPWEAALGILLLVLHLALHRLRPGG